MAIGWVQNIATAWAPMGKPGIVPIGAGTCMAGTSIATMPWTANLSGMSRPCESCHHDFEFICLTPGLSEVDFARSALQANLKRTKGNQPENSGDGHAYRSCPKQIILEPQDPMFAFACIALDGCGLKPLPSFRVTSTQGGG